MLYFSIASLWGFLVGSAVVLACLVAGDTPFRLGSLTALALTGAGVLALVGGVVSSFAYREAARRRSR